MSQPGNEKIKQYISGIPNVFAINLPSKGKPRLYETAEELRDKINEYFENCLNNLERPLLTGLALYLGFASKQTIYDLENSDANPAFSYLIKRARSAIEYIYETGLWNPQTVTGSIFALKQFGWVDNQKIDLGLENLVKAPRLTENEVNDLADKIRAKL